MWRGAPNMEFLIMQCFPVSCSHVPFGLKIPSSSRCSPAPSMQSWRTYGTCAQNGMRKGFNGTWHSQFSKFSFFNFSCPTSFSILRTVRVYTHTGLRTDCTYMNYRRFQIILRVKYFYTNQHKCEVLAGYLSQGCRPGGHWANMWHWTERFNLFFFFNRK